MGLAHTTNNRMKGQIFYRTKKWSDYSFRFFGITIAYYRLICTFDTADVIVSNQHFKTVMLKWTNYAIAQSHVVAAGFYVSLKDQQDSQSKETSYVLSWHAIVRSSIPRGNCSISGSSRLCMGPYYDGTVS